MRTRSILVPNFKLPLEKITIHATFGLTSVDDQVLGRLSRAEDRVDAGHIPATRRDARVDDGQQLLPRRHAPVGEPRKGFGVHLADPRRVVLEAPRSLVVPGRLTPVVHVVHVVEIVEIPAAPDLCRLLLPHEVRLPVDDNEPRIDEPTSVALSGRLLIRHMEPALQVGDGSALALQRLRDRRRQDTDQGERACGTTDQRASNHGQYPPLVVGRVVTNEGPDYCGLLEGGQGLARNAF